MDSRRKRFLTNLRKAKDENLEIRLRYTLTETSSPEEWKDLIQIASEFDIPNIGYGFAFKNMSGNNSYFKYHLGASDTLFSEMYQAFAEACSASSVMINQCKPFPLCLLDKEILRSSIFKGRIRMSCTAHARGFTKNLTINPDLTTFPCNAIGVRGRSILSSRDMDVFGNDNEKLYRSLINHPMDSTCMKCILFYRGFCQGACLAQRYRNLQEEEGLL
jgi:radical SAM protein with 4Fe4S-binding SPASM domain